MNVSILPHGSIGGLLKRTAVAIPMLVASFCVSNAQDFTEAHLSAAKSAIQATNTSGPLDNILPTMAEQAKAALISARPDISGQISDVVDNMAIELAPRRADLENEVANIYARVFTEDQLKTIAEFYASETGKLLLTEAPLIERLIKESSQTWGAGVARDLRISVTKKLAEIDKKSSE